MVNVFLHELAANVIRSDAAKIKRFFRQVAAFISTSLMSKNKPFREASVAMLPEKGLLQDPLFSVH